MTVIAELLGRTAGRIDKAAVAAMVEVARPAG